MEKHRHVHQTSLRKPAGVIQTCQAVSPSHVVCYMMRCLAGNPWFKVRKISKEQYKEMIERGAESSESEEPPAQLPEDAGPPRGRTAQDKISGQIAGGM